MRKNNIFSRIGLIIIPPNSCLLYTSLIIWIKPFHQGISQGVLFNDYKDLNTQIMLSISKKAEDQEDQWIVDENSTILTTIFEKANKVWNLGLK